jgi:uncharacterized membrane protein
VTPATDGDQRRVRKIAELLYYGTCFASVFVGVGMIVGMLGDIGCFKSLPIKGEFIVRTGIALFILLPIATVALMLIIFLHERDYVYVAIAMAVLAIIATGVLIEI